MAIDYFKIGQISGKQFTDVTGAVEKGLEAGFKPLVEWQKKRDKFDADYARLLQSTPNIDNLPELPTNYLPKASEWLISKQQEYAANARTTLKTRPGSPEYQQAVANMNSIKSSVANLKSNLTGINTERKEFLKSKETGEISLGFQNADIYEAYGPNGAITAIDANGNVALTGDGGKSFNWNERQEFFNKSGGVQKDLFVAGDIALKEGEAGKQRDIDYYTEKSKAIVAQYDLPKIKSLVFDDLDGTDTKLAEDAELVSLINSSTPNLPEIRQALANKLGGAMFDVNSNAFKEYSKKQAEALQAKNDKGKPTSTSKSRNAAAEYYAKFRQDPIGLFKRYTDITPEFDVKTNTFKATDVDGTELVYNLNNFNERGAFYRKMLEFSGFDKGTRNNIVDDFDNIVDTFGQADYDILRQAILKTIPQPTISEEPTLLGATEYPEEIINLSNTLPTDLDKFIGEQIDLYPSSGGRSLGSKVNDVKRILRRLPENQRTEKTIARIAYDRYFREAENKRRTSEFEKSESLKPLLKNINEASTQTLGASALQRKNIDAVLRAVNKQDAFELTEQDFLIYEYIEQGGSIEDIANNSNDIDKTFA